MVRSRARLSEVDLTAALAHLASPKTGSEPVVDDSRAFEITGGRHPVVELHCKRTARHLSQMIAA